MQSLSHLKSIEPIARTSVADQVFDTLPGLYALGLEGPKGKYYMPSESMLEYDDTEGYWQMLYPQYEKGCHIFGDVEKYDGQGVDGSTRERRIRQGLLPVQDRDGPLLHGPTTARDGHAPGADQFRGRSGHGLRSGTILN